MTGQELRYKIEQAGYSFADIAMLLGISPQNLQNKLNNKDIKIGFLQDLARAINKSIYYFIEPDDKNVQPIAKKDRLSQKEYKDSGLRFRLAEPITLNELQAPDYRKGNILLVSIKARAGYLAGYGDRKWVEQLDIYSIPGCTNGSYRMFELEGESMYPTFSPGDFVVGRVETDSNSIKSDTIYIIVSRTEGIIIKRILNTNKTPGKLLLGSDNPAFKPLELDCSSIAEMWEFYMLLTTLPGQQDPAVARLRNLEHEVEEIKRLLKKK